MKKARGLIFCMLLVSLAAGSAMAAEGGNPKKGKYLFKKNCKVCHTDGGEAKDLTPMSKTQAQWDRFFDRDGHKAMPEAWKDYSEKDRNDIRQFLFDHAADSPQPQTCG